MKDEITKEARNMLLKERAKYNNDSLSFVETKEQS